MESQNRSSESIERRSACSAVDILSDVLLHGLQQLEEKMPAEASKVEGDRRQNTPMNMHDSNMSAGFSFMSAGIEDAGRNPGGICDEHGYAPDCSCDDGGKGLSKNAAHKDLNELRISGKHASDQHSAPSWANAVEERSHRTDAQKNNAEK
eukprot:TRINITY_DN9925_c1_g1_i1.p1 TRINITY_DN9925_c1_g1~~TRINITY_DN9925_c1_g1_i1.p1  ORF type:complete len:151 (+),score=39.50 TRINITY_DN9925_c1_g1_i1:49-501(+)